MLNPSIHPPIRGGLLLLACLVVIPGRQRQANRPPSRKTPTGMVRLGVDFLDQIIPPFIGEGIIFWWRLGNEILHQFIAEVIWHPRASFRHDEPVIPVYAIKVTTEG